MPSLDKRNKRDDEFASLFATFTAVTDCYLQVLELPLLAAASSGFDTTKPRVINALAIDFLVDVEHAVESVLKDSPAEQETFFKLLNGTPVNNLRAASVIRKVAGVFLNRKLSPHHYFRRIRQGAAPARRAT